MESDEYSLTQGIGGGILLQDHYLVEKMAQFNRERVPERVVHAKGAGAFGEFVVTEDLSAYTKADFLQPGKRTEMLARFSHVAPEQGGADTQRDPRGFALKFYTQQGNYDLVGNNTPVFFMKDPMKFQDFIRSQKRLPDSGLRDNNMQWDFWTLSPESAHQVTWLMGNRGIPRTFRHMDGFGSHTFQWINAVGVKCWVKYHFKTDQGIECLTQHEADILAGPPPPGPIRVHQGHRQLGGCLMAGRIDGLLGWGGSVGTEAPSYKGFRFPAEIISHCVWLYHRFPLSFCEVEEMMLARGVVVSHETIRQRCQKFGQTYANGLRRRRPRPGDKWHLDEMFIKINEKTHYLWRAVDQDGVVLDILVTSWRNAKAATRFFRKLLKGLESVPRVLVTDKLASYGVARRRLLPGVEHRRSKYLNNRAENSHQPTRARERAMKKFTSAGHAQRLLSAFSGISPNFRPGRHRLSAAEYRREMTDRFTTWNQITGTAAAA